MDNQNTALKLEGEYFQTSDGAEYIMDDYGVHQINAEPFVYDEKYCAIYDSPERKAKSDLLQALRLGFILGAHGTLPYTILDFGSGNFAFLNMAKKTIPLSFGYDLADYPVPHDIEKTTDLTYPYSVVVFNDSLEHIEYPGRVIQQLTCSTIVISTPFCPLPHRTIEWFDKEYFHRKKNEHLHHWSYETLTAFMGALGWKEVAVSKHEDIVRERAGENWNILSMAFKRA